MAKKRMFSIPLLESDEFYSFPASTQAIYMHLNMNADDDGVVDNWKSIIRGMKTKKEFLLPLIDNGYLLTLENGALLIADWISNNNIRLDRYVSGRYASEVDKMFVCNGRYYKWIER